MKYILCICAVVLNISLSASQVSPTHMSVSEKKQRFYALVAPEVLKVYDALLLEYTDIQSEIKKDEYSSKIKSLKKKYKLQTNEELLVRMKPHPPSIVLAQAAMESAWATSRFFKEANNIFGVWSINTTEARIAAKIQRADGRTIWLRSFSSLEESVREYYKLLGRGKHFKAFRKVRFESDNIYEMVKELDRYSEIGERYTKELAQLIRYNKLEKYDSRH